MTRTLLAVLGVLLAALPAISQPAVYGEARNAIRAGILLVPSTGSTSSPGGTNADPYVFYNLMMRQDLLPGGWDFYNPYAPSVVTQRVYDRWRAIMGRAPFAVGDRVQRSMAPYWEVYLDDLSDKQLSNYDILLIHAPGTLRFSPDQRERLRRFVDSGGVLWFDKATSQTVDGNSGFPLTFGVSSSGGNPQLVNPTHPLLNYPHKLTVGEATFLGSHRGSHAITPWGAAGEQGFADFKRMTPIVLNSAGGVIMHADMGSGHFVLTACNVVSNINEPAGGTTTGLGRNSGPFAGTNFLNIPTPELKFAYNLVGLTGSHRQFGKGSRKLNATFEDIGAPLLGKWSTPFTPQSTFEYHGRLYKSPVFFKGLLIVSTNTEVLAFDAQPMRDLDGDGNPDDGFPDLSQGTQADLVWRFQVPGASLLSAPLAVETPTEASQGFQPPVNQVWVMDQDGAVYVLNAFPVRNRRLADTQQTGDWKRIDPPRDDMIPFSLPKQPNALTYSDGMIFAAAGALTITNQVRGGIAWVISPKVARIVSTGLDPDSYFVAQGARAVPGTNPFVTAPTVGYVPQAERGGASDQVVYIGTERTTTGGRGGPGFAALWFRTRGEKLRMDGYALEQTKFKCLAANQNLKVFFTTPGEFEELNPRFYGYRQSDGTPVVLPEPIVGAVPGEFIFQGDWRNVDIYADYTIDWSARDLQSGNLNKIARTVMVMPDESTPKQEIIGSLTLAPNGNLFLVSSNVDVTSDPKSGGGSLFCFQERLNNTRLLYRWQLHHGYNHILGGTNKVTVPPVIVDNDPLTKIPPLNNFLDRPMTKMHFHGSPVIHNNMCYVVASARKNLGFFELPVTILLAFDADPQPAEIRVGGPILGTEGDIEVSQPDPAVSLSKDEPTGFNRLSNRQGQGEIEVDAAAGIIRISNFSTSPRGEVRNSISLSQPVSVRVPGQQPFFVDPNATGNRWSPLRWFMTFNGFTNEAPAMVTGNTLYLAGGWSLESFICPPMQIPPAYRAMVIAMDADIPTNDEFLINDPLVPTNTHSNRQLAYLLILPNGRPRFNTHIRWPSNEGLTSMEDFCIRVRQSRLGNSQRALGVIGGDGLLAAWAPDGTFIFERALTLVTDQGRLIEIDNQGFVNWTSENTYAGAVNQGNLFLKVVQLTNPTKAYKLGWNEYLVADTGANRIVRVDRAGAEVRTIEGFTFDQQMLAAGKLYGFTPGDPLNLRQPRDMKTWTDFVPSDVNPFSVKSDLEFWIHYLIADTGNGRLVEVVDRYVADPNTLAVGAPVSAESIGQIVYHSPLNAIGRKYRYHAVDRTQTGVDASGLATFAYVAAVGNWEATGAAVGTDPFGSDTQLQAYSGAGAIIVEYFDQTLDQKDRVIVIHRVRMPDGTLRSFVNPSSVHATPLRWDSTTGRIVFSILIADNQGVIEIAPNASNPREWDVIWNMSNENYFTLRGVSLLASGARKLANGNILITNAYTGQKPNFTDFTGEVVEIRYSDYNPGQPNNGFSMAAGSVRAEIPPLVGARQLKTPLFADRP